MNGVTTVKAIQRHILASVWIAPVLFLSAAMAAGRDDYRQGIEAFRAQQYEQAQEYFLAAEQAGVEGPTLAYNLGATHYRLRHFDDAARYFRRISDDPQWGALAEYNLGLIAEAQKKPADAARHYRQALSKTDSPKVRSLATGRLEKLDDHRSATTAPAWMGYLSGALGIDDNPALVDQVLLPTDQGEDLFVELIGSVSGYLRGRRSNGLRLDGNFFNRNYDDASEFDVLGLGGGLSLENTHGNWRLEQGLRAQNYWLDGDHFSLEGALVLAGSRDLGTVVLHLKNDLAYIDGGSDFDYVNGWRNRFDVAVSRKFDSLRWRLGFRNEYNDRDDLTTAREFYSYSPARNSVYDRVNYRFHPDWSLATHLEYRDSRYRDENRNLNGNGILIEKKRDEQRIQASVLVRYNISDRISAFGEYRYTDNDSNFDRFSYDSNQFMVGLDAVFF